jgi:hypothetical protein
MMRTRICEDKVAGYLTLDCQAVVQLTGEDSDSASDGGHHRGDASPRHARIVVPVLANLAGLSRADK